MTKPTKLERARAALRTAEDNRRAALDDAARAAAYKAYAALDDAARAAAYKAAPHKK